MSGTAVRSAESPASLSLRDFKPSWEVLLLLLGAGVLYAGTIKGLVVNWWQDPDYSHGLLLPFALAYLLWQKKDKLRAMPKRPMWLGLAVIVGAIGAVRSITQVYEAGVLMLPAASFASTWKVCDPAASPV